MTKPKYGRNDKGEVLDEEVTFTVTCTMRKRWAPEVIGMMKKMEQYGGLGCSRDIALFSDGDGDFRPKFVFSDEAIPAADPVSDRHGDLYFDAG